MWIYGVVNWRFMLLWLQDKAMAEMDKEESPAESNESDSEEVAVDQERALAEKEKVDTEWWGAKNEERQEQITLS